MVVEQNANMALQIAHYGYVMGKRQNRPGKRCERAEKKSGCKGILSWNRLLRGAQVL